MISRKRNFNVTAGISCCKKSERRDRKGYDGGVCSLSVSVG